MLTPSTENCQPRLYCLHKLRNIGIDSKILQMHYKCCTESLLTVSFMCWYGSLCVRSKRVLSDVVNVCSKVVGAKQVGMQELYERRALKKARQISNDESHVLAQCYILLPSGRRFRNFKVKTRAQKPFIPCSIKLLNLVEHLCCAVLMRGRGSECVRACGSVCVWGGGGRGFYQFFSFPLESSTDRNPIRI